MSLLQTVVGWFSGTSSAAGARAHAASSGSAGHALRDTNEQRRTVAAAAPWQLETGTATDPGCVRELNEDTLLLQVPGSPDAMRRHGVLAVVCDGMGGHEAGEVASALARDTIAAALRADDAQLPDALVHAIQAANGAIFDAGRKQSALRGMGTTCCALVLRDGAAWCAHVGDSRCYLLRDGDLLLMTEDHSAVMDMVRRGILSLEEARHHPDKNVISRALGSHAAIEVSSWNHPFVVQPDDVFLLCSDGLYDLVSDEDIRTVMMHGTPHAQVACDRLIALARERGGLDNISVVMLHLRAADRPAASPGATRTIEIMR
ncbi:MAG TPA: Stp1/IreP family PP2C-type Ser/Thr phosphatase [Gemmatimonas aurantiaca]|uniref:Stp1/IreP family PP2C-type Ser/Thr phosphatase n=2 Tax=Gemmatimonas aurantiaca TaxID=173480 RepID=A0A3D4VD24_9BACT|nr:Stp1/IreP family PP2C-type Ser/Thr phosphatase [Gemmatimonas aurantiaca]BAH40875.1 putative phosphoprotein phosphatase [Gemmatimonas aurantiaca T-27]HCT59030.1 Stp1/IreP family PP2C-type Ser/Thr phosphatase [Gemmatimonas aurantiaca]